ncbi:MAG: glycosyltransferase family 2 protein [Planctomycetota bacterium]
MPHGLTVLIPCKDERRHLPGAVASAQAIADEVLVADSGSTDGTLQLARELGCRVIEREYVTSGDFKNWAIPQATYDWVLIVDADERVSPKLAREIKQRLAKPATADGYWVRRVNQFFGKPLRFGSWRPTRLLRFFRRDFGRYVGDTDHAEVSISTGRVGKLRSPLHHLAIWSYERYLPKLYRYADVQAQLWHGRGRRTNIWQLVFRGPLRFGQDYVLRGGLFDGAAGLQSAVLVAYGSYLKQARLWELQQLAEQRQREQQQTPAPPSATLSDSAAADSTPSGSTSITPNSESIDTAA